MSQSLSVVHVHLVFSTKLRRAYWQNKETRDELHAYMAAVSRELECPAVMIGGIEDHVHVLARLGRTLSQAEWVKELKRVSALWLKESKPGLHDFQWQNGYAIFAVSHSDVPEVRDYIARQEEHHHRMGFQDELRALLRKHEIGWDERYVWD
jgi:REP element-mobilizing transposase RayT